MSSKVILSLIFLQLAATIVLIVWWGSIILSYAPESRFMILTEGAWFLSVVACVSILISILYLKTLRQKSAVETFLASWSHELKTPLASLKLQAETLCDKQPENKIVKRLMQDSQNLQIQVERALELARLQCDGKVYRQKIDLKEIVGRFINESSLPEGVSLKSDIQASMVYGDLMALEMILRNLLENALSHTKKRPLNISLESGCYGDGRTYVAFKDNGEGSLVRDPSQMFEKSPLSKGAGVGLYLVKSLMRKMGGRANFKSQDGFLVELQFPKVKA